MGANGCLEGPAIRQYYLDELCLDIALTKKPDGRKVNGGRRQVKALRKTERWAAEANLINERITDLNHCAVLRGDYLLEAPDEKVDEALTRLAPLVNSWPQAILQNLVTRRLRAVRQAEQYKTYLQIANPFGSPSSTLNLRAVTIMDLDIPLWG